MTLMFLSEASSLERRFLQMCISAARATCESLSPIMRAMAIIAKKKPCRKKGESSGQGSISIALYDAERSLPTRQGRAYSQASVARGKHDVSWSAPRYILLVKRMGSHYIQTTGSPYSSHVII